MLKHLRSCANYKNQLVFSLQETLLKYLSRPFYQLTEEVWTSEIFAQIDYLMLPTDKLIDHYIVYGKYRDLMIAHRLFREPEFTLFDNNDDNDIVVDMCKSCTIAAFYGYLNVLQWLCENGYPWNWTTCAGAAYAGHLQVLRWVRENDCPWNEFTCESAADGGHLEVLQ